MTSTEDQDPERQVWLTDLDCVWADPERVFAAAPPCPEIGCVFIDYPPDWDTVGFETHGRTRNAIGELARGMGAEVSTPPWVGGELLTGTPGALRELVAACEQLDERLSGEGKTLPNEEQILSLAGALGRIPFSDLSPVARRITTGPRSHAMRVAHPEAIGLWHLPAEKGLSLRRTASRSVAGTRDRCAATWRTRRARRAASMFAAPARCAGCATTAGSRRSDCAASSWAPSAS